MRWRLRPTRSADFPPDGEAVLASAARPGRRGTGWRRYRRIRPHNAKPRNARSRTHRRALRRRQARKASDPSPSAGTEPLQALKMSTKVRIGATFKCGRVPEDMATLVWTTRPWEWDRPHGRTKNQNRKRRFDAALDPASDAASCWRVAAGDESGFNYLVGKYHRAMIHFLFRMVRNRRLPKNSHRMCFACLSLPGRATARGQVHHLALPHATNLAVNHARDTKHERSAQTHLPDAPDEETGTSRT